MDYNKKTLSETRFSRVQDEGMIVIIKTMKKLISTLSWVFGQNNHLAVSRHVLYKSLSTITWNNVLQIASHKHNLRQVFNHTFFIRHTETL